MYNRYSTSEWGGSVPEQWLRIPIKRLFNVVSGATPSSVDSKNWNGSIAWITPADFSNTSRYIVKGKKSITDTGYRSCGTTIVPQGSIVITKRAPIGNVMIAANKLCTNQGCLSLVKKKDLNEGYFYFLLSCYAGIFNALGTGTTFKEISLQTFSDFKIPVPSRTEQDQIVRYLDWKTSEINTLIHRYQAEIGLLREKEQSSICELVLHGSEDHEYCDSGDRFLGKMPTGWQYLRNKYIFRERSEYSETGKEVLLSVSKHYGVKKYSDLKEDEQYATIKPAETLIGYKVVKKNDLVMNIMRARNGSYGISKYDGIVSPAYAVYEPVRECNPVYLHYFMKTPQVVSMFEAYSYGIAEHRRRLYPQDFLRLFSFVPPLSEQNEIAGQAMEIHEKYESLSRKIEKEIELLREYRTRLISDVVTGQMDVRNVKIPDYVPEQDDAENALNETDIGEVDADAE